jgi:DNA-3-methyladenine glycosylase II
MLPEHIARHLAQDPKLVPILAIAEVEDRPDFGGDVYFGLLRAIAYQQLSGKAAATIFQRFLALFPDAYPLPEPLLAFSEAELRSVGLSRAKANYMHNIAQHFTEQHWFGTDWSKLDDEHILQALTAIKGVGKWTAEMVLMFILHRPDVLPLDDLVVRNRMVQLYGLNGLSGKAQTLALEAAAAPWRPYRSWGSRLMWAWAHTEM